MASTLSAYDDRLIGTIGVETNRSSLVSLGIRLRTQSKISHIFIVLGRIGSRYVILEADEKNVGINWLDKYHKKNNMYELYIPKRSPLIVNNALESVTDKYASTPYGYTQIGGFLIQPILEFFIRDPNAKSTNPIKQGVICSELGSYYMEELGFVLPFPDPNYVSPEDLRKWVVEDLKWPMVARSPFGKTSMEVIS